jgi:hypothetical protein
VGARRMVQSGMPKLGMRALNRGKAFVDRGEIGILFGFRKRHVYRGAIHFALQIVLEPALFVGVGHAGMSNAEQRPVKRDAQRQPDKFDDGQKGADFYQIGMAEIAVGITDDERR